MKVLELGLGDLIKVVEKLQGCMKDYKNDLCQSELLTRYLLIDPLLRALGWDTEDPKKVLVEYKVIKRRRKSADYVLFGEKGIIALVEAKKYGTNSRENELINAARQVANYRVSSKVPLGIVTDGGSWCVYDLCRSGPIRSRVILEINFAWESSKKVAKECLKLSRSGIENLSDTPQTDILTKRR